MYVSEGLEKHSFITSKADPYLFICNDAIIYLYTDDCCIFACDNKTIYNLITNLSSEFILKDEGSIEDFLPQSVSILLIQ